MTHRRHTTCIIFGLALALGCRWTEAEPTTPHGDTSFATSSRYTETVLPKTGDRPGWTQRQWSIRFGAYGFRIVQRIDPKTGYPPARRQWGDTFIGLDGKTPARYMSGNWSPWTFVSAEVVLEGDKKPLPSPTLYGKCTYAGLRVDEADRAVAEAVFVDTAGGTLRLRLTGLGGRRDRLGVMLRYHPPEGRTLKSIRYHMVCQPYDYSDRGYWQRKRWLTMPGRSVELKQETPVEIDPGKTRRFVMHNRFAHNTAGTFVALPAEGVKTVSVEARGKTVQVALQPTAADRWTTVLAGDWVHRSWAEVARRLFDEKDTDEQLDRFRMVELPAPKALPAWQHASIDRLLSAHQALQEQYGETVERLRKTESTLHAELVKQAGGPAPVDAEVLSTYDTTRRDLVDTYRAIRAAWVTRKLWTDPTKPAD